MEEKLQAEFKGSNTLPSQGCPFRCGVCHLQVSSVESLSNHLTDHAGQLSYQCYTCSESFPNTEMLANHIGKHELKKAYCCGICSASFCDNSLLVDHLKAEHEDLPFLYKCRQCGSNFADLSILKTHVAYLHNNNAVEKVFECSFCLEKFAQGDILQDHVLSGHADKISNEFSKTSVLFQCSNCHKGFETQAEMKEHSNQSCRNSNLHNGFIQRMKISLDSVQFEDFSKCEDDEKSPNGIKPDISSLERTIVTNNASVSVCTKKRSKRKKRQVESKTEKKRSVPSSISPSPGYKCEECGEVFQKEISLKIHLNKSHLNGAYTVECPLCNSEFNSVSELYKHHKISGCEGFKCSHCSKRYSLENELIKHVVRNHYVNGKSSYSCNKCSKTFQTLDCLSAHAQRHVEYKVVKCNICSARSWLTYDMFIHLKRIHGIGVGDNPNNLKMLDNKRLRNHRMGVKDNHEPKKRNSNTNNSARMDKPKTDFSPFYSIVCSLCGDVFDNFSALEHHHNTSNCEGFVCVHCELPFPSESDLFAHVARKHTIAGQSGYSCSHCSKTCKSLIQLSVHARSHSSCKPYECKLCAKRFYTLKYQVAHLQEKHRIGRKKESYLCSVCGMCFSKQRNLSYHVAVKHTMQKHVLMCDLCNQRFTWRSNLQRHLGTHSSDNAMQCHVCGQEYFSRDNLNYHLLSHSQERPFQCHLCTYSSKTKGCLKRHVATHFPRMPRQKKHACPDCGKAFPDKTHMNIHRRVHSDVRPHVCEVCGRGFARPDYLKTHMKVHTGEKPYSCPVCDRTFALSSNRTSHVRKTHPGYVLPRARPRLPVMPDGVLLNSSLPEVPANSDGVQNVHIPDVSTNSEIPHFDQFVNTSILPLPSFQTLNSFPSFEGLST